MDIFTRIGRAWDDRIWRLEHGRRVANPDRERLMLLDDHWYPTFLGTREWCDGRRRECNVCNQRCCPCQHSDRPAVMPERD